VSCDDAREIICAVVLTFKFDNRLICSRLYSVSYGADIFVDFSVIMRTQIVARLQMRFLGSKYANNASPQTPLGELTALPQTP